MLGENLEKDMTPVLLEDLGLKYPTKNSKQRYRYGLYRCQYCGKVFEARICRVNAGNPRSCGCLHKLKVAQGATTHGVSKHPLYDVWRGMKKRCYNANVKHYKYYGGLGIQVCDRWLDINNFIEDMYPSYKVGLTLDRINVNGDYEPDNCRWTTKQIQGRNTRDIISTNKSGFRGVNWRKPTNNWEAGIKVNNKRINLGCYPTALEAAKAYERYVRLNNLEHNFTPALTEEEIEELNKEVQNANI